MVDGVVVGAGVEVPVGLGVGVTGGVCVGVGEGGIGSIDVLHETAVQRGSPQSVT